jgi:DNA-directed RNA polymerase
MQTFSGLDYTKIAVANAFGNDKDVWDDRIDWAEKFLEKQSAHTMRKADEPFLMRKAVNAYNDAVAGKATGYIMGLDATSSGLQIMAALSGCLTTARNVNLINTGSREDIYLKVTKRMQELCPHLNITRNLLKHPIMTFFYNSKAQPEGVFGKDTPELDAFYEVLHELLPGAMEVMRMIQACWNPEATEHKWTAPDGHVSIPLVMDYVDTKIEVEELGKATFTHRAKIVMSDERGLSLPANVNQSIDAYIVRMMYRMAHSQGWEILTVHDAFFCTPNNVNRMRMNYNKILSKIASSNMLCDILKEITGNKGTIKKMSTTLPGLILKANYSLS